MENVPDVQADDRLLAPRPRPHPGQFARENQLRPLHRGLFAGAAEIGALAPPGAVSGVCLDQRDYRVLLGCSERELREPYLGGFE